MSSSFRRRKVPGAGRDSVGSSVGTGVQLPATRKGTKPWTGGITLTSTGLRDLDAILGGGQPLGTLVLLEEDDKWSNDLTKSLIKYWCAEGICHEQALLIPIDETKIQHTVSSLRLEMDDIGSNSSSTQSSVFATRHEVKNRLLMELPRNLHWDAQAQKSTSGIDSVSAAPLPLEILEEDCIPEDKGEAGAAEEAERGLKNAWQYRKSVMDERSGIASSTTRTIGKTSSSDEVFCHSFDLSGRLADQIEGDLEAKVHFVDHTCVDKITNRTATASRVVAFHLYQQLITAIRERIVGDKSVVRLLLHQVSVSVISMTLPLLMASIHEEDLPVIVLVTARTWQQREQQKQSLAADWIHLQRNADVVLRTQAFASRYRYPPPAEFRHLQGVLLVPKVTTMTGSTANGGGGGHFADVTLTKRPAASVYGLKRDRRKLHIPLLHIPPEDYAGDGSVEGGGVRSGAGKKKTRSSGGLGCASNLEGSVLDF